MAVPIHFEETNFIVPVADERAGGSVPVPVFRRADGRLVSCWYLSLEERQEIARTGRVWVALAGGDGLAMPEAFVTGNKEDLAA